jgi:hemerythrin-like domain-containing protein
MMPIGLLMIEHRLTERAVPLVECEQDRLRRGRSPDVARLTEVVDFLRTYADRCHPGKEEDILFAELREKEVSQQHQTILDQLLREHEQAREAVRELSEGLTPGRVKQP